MSPRRADPKAKAQSGGLPNWVFEAGIAVVIVIAVLVALAVTVLFNQPTSVPPVTVSGLTSKSRTMGDPNAKLEMIEFSDFQ